MMKMPLVDNIRRSKKFFKKTRENFAKSLEKHLWQFKERLGSMFSYEFNEVFSNSSFTRHISKWLLPREIHFFFQIETVFKSLWG